MLPFQPYFPEFDSDEYPQKVVALQLTGGEQEAETPFHQHRKCQIVIPLTGFVKCKIADAIWMVPPHCAVWIPSHVPHSNKISADANVCMLFIDPDAIVMPDQSCTISISPLVRELIVHLTIQDQHYLPTSQTARLVNVLIEQLTTMPTEHFDFPIPVEPRLNAIALRLLADPSDRRTVSEWAEQFAMSERTLARLVKQEIGLTFGKWRGQLHIVVALQKLASGDSVQRIADHLGYESVSAFITFFKKTLGRPPKQYMKGREA
jgi:AraC-like DNA-binding protein